MMPKDNGHGQVVDAADAVPHAAGSPVLAVGLGRGGGGKSTGLSELVWRARAQGREVVVADGDARSRTLVGAFPDATSPEAEELPDVKEWLSGVLNRMVDERRSAVLDLGGGDRVLQEYGKDLGLVEFCEEYGIEPLALYFLGPEEEDLAHVLSIWEGGYFRPRRTFLVMNEGVIREGRTMAGAFERTLGHSGLAAMVEAGAVPVMMKRLACMDLVKRSGVGPYAAAAGVKGAAGKPLDPTYAFMTKRWLRDLEAERAAQAGWLP